MTRKTKHQAKSKRSARFFPTPIEVRLLEILGGTTITIGAIRQKRTGYPLTITLSRGRLLRSYRFRRRVLNDMGVLANDVRWAVAIQGPEYERDVVAAYERDERLAAAGWRVRYIPAARLWHNPALVRRQVLQFLG